MKSESNQRDSEQIVRMQNQIEFKTKPACNSKHFLGKIK